MTVCTRATPTVTVNTSIPRLEKITDKSEIPATLAAIKLHMPTGEYLKRAERIRKISFDKVHRIGN